MHHELKITGDAAVVRDAPPAKVKQKERLPFIVAAEAGMFKNGKAYAKGDTIMLDADTAARARSAGDIE